MVLYTSNSASYKSSAALVSSKAQGGLIVELPPQQLPVTPGHRSLNTFPCHSITLILLMAHQRECVTVQAVDLRILLYTLL